MYPVYIIVHEFQVNSRAIHKYDKLVIRDTDSGWLSTVSTLNELSEYTVRYSIPARATWCIVYNRKEDIRDLHHHRCYQNCTLRIYNIVKVMQIKIDPWEEKVFIAEDNFNLVYRYTYIFMSIFKLALAFTFVTHV